MFKCTNDSDFGVLLIFYPAGSDSSGGTSCTNVNPVASTNYYCTVGNTNAGSDNQLQVQAGANFYVSSSQKYHAVSVFVDTNHPYPSTTLNFTDSTKLSAVGCVTNSCALQIGIGSHVIYVQGGGSVSINGAILAPADNTFLGGGGNGKGYGQILTYTTNFIGNAAIKEAYNPIALAYTKEAIRSGSELPLTAGLVLEADLAALLQTTADRAEGIRAFKERKLPRFEGR